MLVFRSHRGNWCNHLRRSIWCDPFHFLILIIAHDLAVRNIFESILRQFIFVDEKDGVGGVHMHINTLGQLSNFICERLAPNFLYFGHWINCEYSNIFSVSPSNARFMYSTRNCKGKPWEHVFMAVSFMEASNISIIIMMASCVTDLVAHWDHVFLAGVSLSWEIIVGAGEACCLLGTWRLFLAASFLCCSSTCTLSSS